MGTVIVGGVIEKDGKFLLVQEMKEELRSYNWIVNSITALIENKVADINLVKMM